MNKKPPGRPKGAKNVRTILVEETAAKLGFDPFKTLCLFAMGAWKELGYEAECYFKETESGSVKMNYVISPDMRMKAAESACKYLYSPKQAADAEGNTAIKIILEDYSKKD